MTICCLATTLSRRYYSPSNLSLPSKSLLSPHSLFLLFSPKPILTHLSHSRSRFHIRKFTPMSSISPQPIDTPIVSPYGSWSSPITSDVVSGSDKRLGGFAVDSRGQFYWTESRPNESG